MNKEDRNTVDLDDRKIADLVNEVTVIAYSLHGTQSLRQVISEAIVKALKEK